MSWSFRITGHLGSGEFGNVEKGTWQLSSSNTEQEVALKTLKEGSVEQDKVKFLQEAAIMAQFKHPNIVTLYGVVSDKEPVSKDTNFALCDTNMHYILKLMLVVEMMHQGDLRDHLLSMKPE